MANQLEQLLERQTTLIEMLAKQQNGSDLHTKAPANFSTYTPLHGPGGIWAANGIERDVITAHIRPQGLASRLPLIPTNYTNPLFGILTGYTGTTGDQPQYACEDAPVGYVKGCTTTARLGLFRMDSQTIDLDDVALRLHRGDFTDLMLRGQVLGMTNLNPQTTNQSEILNVVSASEMVTMGVNIERSLSRQLWQGSVLQTNQFPGLDTQIATGHVDAVTGTSCPAVDSDVKNFALNLVGGTGLDIVEYLSSMAFYLGYNASAMGLDPVEWVIVMRPELWQELTAIWPCRYNTNRCNSGLGSNVQTIVDGRENIADRDSMRQGMYLDINGVRYPVVIDTGIYEHNNANNGSLTPGQYASSIYFVPLRIVGGFPVTYREYVDFRMGATDYGFTQGKLDVWWTDNGVFSWSITQNKWCYKFHAKTEQRVILRTPHLAGRIDNVRYQPLQHLREAYPDSPYFYDGGVSLRNNVPAYSTIWPGD